MQSVSANVNKKCIIEMMVLRKYSRYCAMINVCRSKESECLAEPRRYSSFDFNRHFPIIKHFSQATFSSSAP
uniref:Ovule protein n=1 Tax=Parascaris univalens TaxID=6257 RepID=A0A915ABM7_PARUN